MPATRGMTLNRPVIIVLGIPRHLYRHGWGRLLGATVPGVDPRRPSHWAGPHHGAGGRGISPGQRRGLGRVWLRSGSDWLRNIQANGQAEISIGRDSFLASFRMVPVEEATRILADYERRNRLAAPLIRVVLSRLLGWRYDGSTEARRRAAEALPVVAFSRCCT